MCPCVIEFLGLSVSYTALSYRHYRPSYAYTDQGRRCIKYLFNTLVSDYFSDIFYLSYFIIIILFPLYALKH